MLSPIDIIINENPVLILNGMSPLVKELTTIINK